VRLPVVCGEALIRLGDLIVADDDGVCVAPRAWCAEREAKEAKVRVRLQAGERSLDIYAVRQQLAAKGLKYLDE
jgi:4-hydroxy-4-methyl-2-oxoglutarate aldolase